MASSAGRVVVSESGGQAGGADDCTVACCTQGRDAAATASGGVADGERRRHLVFDAASVHGDERCDVAAHAVPTHPVRPQTRHAPGDQHQDLRLRLPPRHARGGIPLRSFIVVVALFAFFNLSNPNPNHAPTYTQNPKQGWTNFFDAVFDIFAVAHSLGWWAKAVLFRDYWCVNPSSCTSPPQER